MRSPMMWAARSPIAAGLGGADGAFTKVSAPFFFALAAALIGATALAGTATAHAAAFGLLLLVLVVAILLGSVVLGVIEWSGRPA